MNTICKRIGIPSIEYLNRLYISYVSREQVPCLCGCGELISNTNHRKFVNRTHAARYNQRRYFIPVPETERKISHKKSIYKGVGYLGTLNITTNRRLWRVQYKGKNHGTFDTENQAAIYYNELTGKAINKIIDTPPHNLINLEYLNDFYYNIFWLTTSQIVEIITLQLTDKNKSYHTALINFLVNKDTSIYNFIPNFTPYFESIIRKIDIKKKKKRGFVINRKDLIWDGYIKALELTKKGKFKGGDFKMFVGATIKTLYKIKLRESILDEPEDSFIRKQEKEHEKELELLYS